MIENQINIHKIAIDLLIIELHVIKLNVYLRRLIKFLILIFNFFTYRPSQIQKIQALLAKILKLNLEMKTLNVLEGTID